ncbi:transcription initiation factor TFIID subunit 12-like [Mytilus californianus]|uniref:transcription initiation factor TFIID subunit 12-like n=1 Tax=Mytilus californianus TaxID=6549 RepID=UPI00224522CF|nr:transcription initiation factor TFIID subunit 12-like [Mytilus californianus]
MKREQTIVPLLYLITFLPALAANIQPIDVPSPSSQNGDSARIVATSLDHPPVWIDPIASDTFSQSQTPFFNWESLMSSSNMNNFPQTGGDIPTFQLGEGIPMDSVQVIENVGQITQDISAAVQTDTKIAQQKDSQASLTHLSTMNNVNTPLQEILHHPNPASSVGILDQDATSLKNNIGVDPRLMSPDNPAVDNPNLLSPDNPTHADLIDFMIAKDMAQGTETVIHQKPTEINPFGVNQEHENIFPKAPSHDVLPRIETSPSRSSAADISTPIRHQNINTKKQQRKAENKERRKMQQQQRQARNKERRQMQQQQRRTKQVQRQQMRQIQQQERQQLRKQQREERNKKIFAQKLALRQQKQKARIQQKIEQQIKKLENLEKVGLNQQTAVVDKQAFRVNNKIKKLKSRRVPKGKKGKFRRGKWAKGAIKKKSKGKPKK